MSKWNCNRAVIPILILLYCLTSYDPVCAQKTSAGAYAINDLIVEHHPKLDTPILKDHFAERQFYIVGVAASKKKDYNLVKRLAQGAIKGHPNWCAPYILLGRIAKEEFEDDEAMAQFRKGAKAAPLCTLPLKELAMALQRDTEYEKSIAVVDSTLNMIGDINDSEMRLTKGDLYLCKGIDLTALKRHDQALASMEQHYQYSFDYTLSGSRLAEAYVKAKQYQNAVKFCNARLKVTPVLLDYYLWRGLSYKALGQDKMAIADLNKFIQRNNSTIAVNSKDRTARTARAELYEKTGQTQLAKADRSFLQKEQIDAYNDTAFRDRRK